MFKTKCSWLQKKFVIKFWGLRHAYHVKFTKEYVMCMEKYVLVKKDVYKWAKHGFATAMSQSQKVS